MKQKWFIVASVGIAAWLFFSPGQQVQYQKHIAQLQYDQSYLTRKVSEAEAKIALRDSQLESMQRELMRNAHDMHAMTQRLDMFDDVLAARKVGGWHILHPTAHWQDEHTIVYQLVVVKGENYPRWAKGRISFSVIDEQGELMALVDKRGEKPLKFDMMTHAFFEGVISWPKDWHAKMLIVSLIDKRGRNNQTIEVPILKLNASSPAEGVGAALVVESAEIQ